MRKLHNHITPGFSQLEMQMVNHIPPGGNWASIPPHIPSQRLKQIRESGGRTTYYGRLRYDKPSYTISTYFNRIGNGCHIHPSQNRLISLREGARLQSFKDNFIFHGAKTSQFKQIGNAVPPLLARAVATEVKKHVNSDKTIDLFSGAGGFSEGFKLAGFDVVGAIEIEKRFFETFLKNNPEIDPAFCILGDIRENKNKERLSSLAKKYKIGVVVGGPPCQGFSHAGWRNPKDARNDLFVHFVDLVKKIKPEAFVMENVPGILSMRKGAALKEIVEAFEGIGYHVNEPWKLKAEEYGVPQRRRRVFITGFRTETKLASPKPLFSDGSDGLPSFITVKDAIYGLPALKPNSGEMEVLFDGELYSPYQEFLMGKKTFAQFYEVCIKKKLPSYLF